jgi:hypothetical protein
MSGVGTGIALAAGLGVAGSIGGAAISSSAAGNAAQAQESAADYAAQLQYQEAQNALGFQEQEWNTQQKNLAPWLQGGQQGLKQLETLLGVGGNTTAAGYGSLLTPFTPPTIQQAEQYPGYQFGLQQGEQALQNSAAAKGNVFSGNTSEALNNYAQNYAQQDYSNVYNQAFNTFETNQANTYNRLAALSGLGQQTATTLGSEGQQAASNAGNIDITLGAQEGQDYQNAAAAEASGYIGSANAWSSALSGGSSNLMNLALLSQLYGGGSGQYATIPGGDYGMSYNQLYDAASQFGP